MFDALKGLKEAILEAQKIPEERIELTPDRIAELDEKLRSLQKGQQVIATYYCDYSRAYIQLSGEVSKVDAFWHCLQIGEKMIEFQELYDLVITA